MTESTKQAMSEGVRRAWAALTPEQRQARLDAIRQGIVTRDSARQARLARRRKLRNLDVDTAGPRCGVCGLLEPHECLDGAMVRVNEPESFPVRRRS